MENPHKHITLAGDSIFDNDGYVPNEPGVIAQLRTSIPKDWSASKIAVDGDCIRHVYSRVEGFPDYITDLVLSIGGNDALGYSSALNNAKSLSDIPGLVAPFEDPIWRQYVPLALGVFNNIIKEEAAVFGVGLIEIDKVCVEDADYSKVSPIEPSAIGGQKIVDAIIQHLESEN